MNITISYDASVNSAPAAFKADVAAVVAYFESQYTDNISFNLHVGYGEVHGTTMPAGYLGQSYAFYDSFGYSQIKAALTGDAATADDATAVATLPASDPDPIAHTWFVSEAQQKALGLLSNAAVIDAYVGFSKPANAVFDYDRSNGIAAGDYDFIGTVAHEITEVMGRNLEDNTLFIGSNPSVTPLDLFHYSAASTRSFSLGGYFSFDDGVTHLDPFNFLNDGSDPGDWAPGAGNDAYLNESGSGVYNNISITDLRLMDVIGWDSTGDDYGTDTNFAGLARVNVGATGTINSAADHDWIRVRLIAGAHYAIGVSGQDTHGGTNADSAMHIYDSNSLLLISRDDSSSSRDPHLLFTPQTTGFYYVDIYSPVGDTGSYALSVAQPVAAGLTDISVPENSTAVTIVNDSSDSASGPLTYSIAGGADAAFFQIDAASGALSFIAAPDFEKPADIDHNNTYIVQVNAGDGAFFSDDQTIVATVTNVNDAERGDFDGDGHGDILWQTDGGELAAWEMNGVQVGFADYTKLGQSNVGLPEADWHVVDTGDFDGDGNSDLLWRTDSGAVAIWEMDGTQIKTADFTQLGSTSVGTPGADWHMLGAADFDGDGKSDLLWRTDSGALAIWEMNGTQIKAADYTKLGSANVGIPSADWHLVGTGDFDGDGKSDLLWRTDSGALAIWDMNGTQIKAADYLKLGGSNVGAPGHDWHVIGTGDFDGDGKGDLLWQTDSGALAIWEMNGIQIKAADYLKLGQANVGVPSPDWHFAGTSDYNGDGKNDLLWHTDSGALAIWQMNGTQISAADYTKLGSANVGTPSPDWHVFQHHYDLV